LPVRGSIIRVFRRVAAGQDVVLFNVNTHLDMGRNETSDASGSVVIIAATADKQQRGTSARACVRS
jgi:hypothetical protein